MIEEIHVAGLGVIDEATLPLGPGFTAITGETGAGKTMVVTALGLLMGRRADAAVVRAGASSASVDGVWIVPAHGDVADLVAESGGELEPIDEATAELFLGRTIAAEGRSRARVAGRAAPAGVLADLAERLVVVHGQSDQLRLRGGAAQREALDRFGGDQLAAQAATYRQAWQSFRAATDERDRLVAERSARQDEAAVLRDQLEAIDAIDPQPGEDDELRLRAERLGNAEAIRESAVAARESLQSEADALDVTTLLAQARRDLERSGDDDLNAIGEQLADLSYRTADAAGELSRVLADLDDAGPAELAAVEERRALLAGLTRLHGSLEAVLTVREHGATRLVELDGDDERIEHLHRQVDDLGAALDDAAAALTAQRQRAAAALSDAVTTELHALALPDARFEVTITPSEPTATGRDEVEFLLAPHPGATPRSLAKSASGGELSRVMLAVEVVMAHTHPVPTFVFDEVDAGIGGAAAMEIGRRLRALAQTSQVIAVTHLAQVAAFATNHLRVVKNSDGQQTTSEVAMLSGAQREAEMARLLSGLVESDAARSHARELLALGAQKPS